MVVAAGNENQDACKKSPASDPKAITVGATGEIVSESLFFSLFSFLSFSLFSFLSFSLFSFLFFSLFSPFLFFSCLFSFVFSISYFFIFYFFSFCARPFRDKTLTTALLSRILETVLISLPQVLALLLLTSMFRDCLLILCMEPSVVLLWFALSLLLSLEIIIIIIIIAFLKRTM